MRTTMCFSCVDKLSKALKFEHQLMSKAQLLQQNVPRSSFTHTLVFYSLMLYQMSRREGNECSKMTVEIICTERRKGSKNLDLFFWSTTNTLILLLSFDRLCPLIFHSSSEGEYDIKIIDWNHNSIFNLLFHTVYIQTSLSSSQCKLPYIVFKPFC